jgi:hypothetical protein
LLYSVGLKSFDEQEIKSITFDSFKQKAEEMEKLGINNQIKLESLFQSLQGIKNIN